LCPNLESPLTVRDDRDFVIDILDQQVPLSEIRGVEFTMTKAIGNISQAEINSLYYLIVGYWVKQNEGVCPNCICFIETSITESDCYYMTALTY
jgi:hypothetical protein